MATRRFGDVTGFGTVVSVYKDDKLKTDYLMLQMCVK